jgi:WD40 repeat protein
MNFDFQSVQPQRTWQHDAQLTCCRFSPDGQSLIAAGHLGQLHRYRLEGDEHESIEAHRSWVEAMQWTPDRSHLLTADSWGQVCCWRWEDGRLQTPPVWRIASACASWLRDLAISPDGRWLATCGNEPVVRVFSTRDGKLIHELRRHEHPVMSVAFAPDVCTA